MGTAADHAEAGSTTNANDATEDGGRDTRAKQWGWVGGATCAEQWRGRRRAKRTGG
jgi:hypothetical protein